MITKIEKSANGNDIIVAYYEKQRFCGVKAIIEQMNEQMDLATILEKDGDLDHILYLVKTHYKPEYIQESIDEIQSMIKNKVDELMKNMANGHHSAVAWFCKNGEIATNPHVQAAAQAYAHAQKIKWEKVLKMDEESVTFFVEALKLKKALEQFKSEIAKRANEEMENIFKAQPTAIEWLKRYKVVIKDLPQVQTAAQAYVKKNGFEGLMKMNQEIAQIIMESFNLVVGFHDSQKKRRPVFPCASVVI